DVMIGLLHADPNRSSRLQASGGIKISEYIEEDQIISKFDLSFHFIEMAEKLELSIVYNSDIYTESTVDRLYAHLEQLLASISANPSHAINQLDYLNAEEKHVLLVAFNETHAGSVPAKTIVDLFEEQVAKTPDNIALVFEDKYLTYKGLSEQSNKLAHYLRGNYRVRANDLVGVLLDRSDKLVITILGILKSGAAYVPIDPYYPKARRLFIVDDAVLPLLITQP